MNHHLIIFALRVGIALLFITIIDEEAHAMTPAIGETWMGIYFGDTKVGYARMKTSKVDYKGKPAYRLDTISVTRMLVLGEQVEQTVESSMFMDSKSAPMYQIFKMSSAGHETKIRASYSSKSISVQIDSDGTRSTEEVPIPPGSMLIGDSTFFSPMIELHIGDTIDLRCFNPLTLALDDIKATVLRREPLSLDGKVYDTLVVESETPVGKMISWQDNEGEIIKVTMLMGIMMLREPKDVAISLHPQESSYLPTDDLAVMTSAQANLVIPDPRKVCRLVIRFHGNIDKSSIISDSRQIGTLHDGNEPYVEYCVYAKQYSISNMHDLPITDKSLCIYLEDTPYIQPSDAEIKKIAGEIVGDERNAYNAASKIRAWVYSNMRTKGNIGILRSSVDILHAREGVCRDYAILCTTLARAAGIPAKVAAGLIYWHNGFYYHAWSEVYTGEWIPLDATLPDDFVDATHIKLSEGEATDMFGSIRTMGSLKAEVIGFGHMNCENK